MQKKSPHTYKRAASCRATAPRRVRAKHTARTSPTPKSAPILPKRPALFRTKVLPAVFRRGNFKNLSSSRKKGKRREGALRRTHVKRTALIRPAATSASHSGKKSGTLNAP